MTTKNKEQSTLVKTVMALDHHFSELLRLSDRIEGMELKSESDFKQMQRLMSYFAECGQSISAEVSNMSIALNEARITAEEAAQRVVNASQGLQSRQEERDKKDQEFRNLAEKVQTITLSLSELKKIEGEQATEEDRANIAKRLAEVELQLLPLIDESRLIREGARIAKMKNLESSAQSLNQSLLAVRQKITSVQQLPLIQ